jgi:hypothetical protein
VEVADIDGDGDLDVLVANSGGGNDNAMYMNEGGGELRKVMEGAFVSDGGYSTGGYSTDEYSTGGPSTGGYSTDGGSQDVEVADIDGDGDLDVLVANMDGSAGQNNAMYMNEGEGELLKVTEGAFVTDGGRSTDVEVADIDGDGDLDILVANDYEENNAMYMNEGGGELRKVTEGALVTDGGRSTDVEVADIDGDGDLDVLVTNNWGENNAMYMNEGGGELRKVTEGAFVSDGGLLHEGSTDVEVADIDGDGDLDVLVANYGENNDGGNNALYIQDECAAGSALLATGSSWCFDCPTFATQERLGDGACGELPSLSISAV